MGSAHEVHEGQVVGRWYQDNARVMTEKSMHRLPYRRVRMDRVYDDDAVVAVGDDQQRLTMFDNRAMGTAMYMSPEQWKTTSVDIRADIYSLGCTLYHLLAGQPPFLESDLRPEKAHEKEALPPSTRSARPNGVSTVSYATEPTTSTDISACTSR